MLWTDDCQPCDAVQSQCLKSTVGIQTASPFMSPSPISSSFIFPLFCQVHDSETTCLPRHHLVQFMNIWNSSRTVAPLSSIVYFVQFSCLLMGPFWRPTCYSRKGGGVGNGIRRRTKHGESLWYFIFPQKQERESCNHRPLS